jgi:hypothetical protein
MVLFVLMGRLCVSTHRRALPEEGVIVKRYPLHLVAALALVLGAVSLAPAPAAMAPVMPAPAETPRVVIGFTDVQLREFAGGPVSVAVDMLRAAGQDVSVVDAAGGPSAGTVVERIVADGVTAFVVTTTP